jgi:tRNA(adenine34) deaminase
MPGFIRGDNFFFGRPPMHEIYMRQALALAHEAAGAGEVPVGCVIVQGGAVVGRGRNRREEKHSALSHAETEAIAQANAALGSWRLEECALYVTLEPCPMCAGAILNARIPRVFFGARDRAMGACGGVMNLFMEEFPHRPALVGGLLEEECAAVLGDFFRRLRRGERG